MPSIAVDIFSINNPANKNNNDKEIKSNILEITKAAAAF
ncbi:unnamed protein product, partial [marine sediment metagenome]